MFTARCYGGKKSLKNKLVILQETVCAPSTLVVMVPGLGLENYGLNF